MDNSNFSGNQEVYDAIVVGTGISGGWAAKELCESGLKTLVLERGRMVKHIVDYDTAHMDDWDFPNNGQPTREEKAKYHKQARTPYNVHDSVRKWFVNDIEHPYNETKKFDWIRGYHVGGRSITWGRHSYRFSDLDFMANKREGIGIDWPVRYKDIAPWYDKVESYIGVTGEKLGLSHLPDGIFEPMMPLNCVESHLKVSVDKNFKDRVITAGRTAHINSDTKFKGRTRCQYRSRCKRGCPFGAYFSSLSSTLPAAERTGNMTIRPNSLVHEIIYDPNTKSATGVKVIDSITNESFQFSAKVIFLCASTIASTSILLQSVSDDHPNGMGNESGQLGRNVMDHHLLVGARGWFDGFEDKYYKGKNPTGIYIPRFRNLGNTATKKNYKRGFGFQGGAYRSNDQELIAEYGYGKELKNAILKPGNWNMGLGGFGEILPYEENKMSLDYTKLDKWGLPTVTFDAQLRENELEMRKDMKNSAAEMLEKAGFKNVVPYDNPTALGRGIHEMGTARMGKDPKTSVLNKYNQIHNVKNVYVTDGSFMTSASCVNPSLTYMAFTARAAHHAVQQLKKGAI